KCCSKHRVQRSRIAVGAPFIEKLRGNIALAGAMSAITEAVVGVILNLAIWFALHTLFAEVATVEIGGLRIDIPVLQSAVPAAMALSAAAAIAI
ncbi:hypothetical protein ACC713_36485, partial [Rhizobium johnstonii]